MSAMHSVGWQSVFNRLICGSTAFVPRMAEIRAVQATNRRRLDDLLQSPIALRT
ncbi:hypothetical protein [Pedosphaera parvula]|uniref:Uncharacterized protein n=1 Tax=Pedosphaera parvula (strain Ellin514) TaxID=320771 RepID=B9X9X0_PEDPL|nr:hypothetical protein [Pedosphaera parvula]EEF63311.1 hypothetical protein Cflav_PD5946 [Pedosphaera parvula Ellin514]